METSPHYPLQHARARMPAILRRMAQATGGETISRKASGKERTATSVAPSPAQ